MRWLTLLVVYLAMLAAPLRAATHAVLIGIDGFDNADITPLRYTVKDVTAFRDLLIDPRYGAVPQENVVLLTPSSEGGLRPTRANIMLQILTGARRTQAGDTLILYFAGHGMQSAEGQFLLGVDANPLLLADTAVPLERLPALLQDARADQIVIIIDACRNDPSAGRAQADNPLTDDFMKALRPRLIQPAANANAQRKVATWLACNVGERAWEMTDEQHGVFSYHLLAGLRGSSRDDQGRVTLRQLAAYVERNVSEWARRNGRAQTPTLDNPDNLDVVLATPNTRAGSTGTGPAVVAIDGTLKVTTTPPGATVRIDNEGVGVTPLTHPVLLPDGQPKDVTISIELEGYAQRRFRATLVPGETTTVPPVTLERLEQPINNPPQIDQPPPQRPEQPVTRTDLETTGNQPGTGDIDFTGWLDTWETGPDGLPLAQVAGGTVRMGRPGGGDPAEGPQISVEVAPFSITATEVNNQAYCNYLNAISASRDPDGNPISPEGMPLLWLVGTKCDIYFEGKTGQYAVREGREYHPVVAVTWGGAASYAMHFGMTLPTEAQWEAAAQGRSANTPYPWGPTLLPAACNTGGRLGDTIGINGYANGSSASGALNMVGNVAEWTRDFYAPDYHETMNGQAEPWVGDPRGQNLELAVRGGSYATPDELASIWTRIPMQPFQGADDVGFRCVSLGDFGQAIQIVGPVEDDDDDPPPAVTTLLHPDTGVTILIPPGYEHELLPPMNVVTLVHAEDDENNPTMAYFVVAKEITDHATVLQGLQMELENLGVQVTQVLEADTAIEPQPEGIELHRRMVVADADGQQMLVVLDSLRAYGTLHGLVCAFPSDKVEEQWGIYGTFLTGLQFPREDPRR